MNKVPVVSVITPSYNQGKFIEETIKSTLSQAGNFELDYIIIDGQSSDNSVQTIQRYENLLNSGDYPIKCRKVSYRWMSKKDNGQADAINKGFNLSTGDILCWLNSDDIYVDCYVLSKVCSFFNNKRTAKFVYGRGYGVDEQGAIMEEEWYVTKHSTDDLREIDFILQPSAFWRREVFERIGLLNTKYNYVFDWDYWVRCSENYKLYFIDEFLSCYRYHKTAKTRSGKINRYKEILQFLLDHDSLTQRALNQYIINHSDIVLQKNQEIRKLKFALRNEA